jgi:glycosyltransferase involved in cell wall biosynthesis
VTAVSILVPFFNRHGLIGECLGSIVAQDFADVEVIVVDDGSTPALEPADLGAAQGDRRIRLIRQDNCGSGAARNRALAEASGDYVLFLDSDDRLVGGGLGALWRCAQESGADAVVGNWRDFTADETGPPIRPSFNYRDALANAVEDGWATGSAILKRGLPLRCSEERSRLPWDMAECYLRAVADPKLKIAHADHDVVMMRQDSGGRLTVLYDHFDPLKAGAFWREMKGAFELDDERRSAFDRQIFRFVFSLFHDGRPAEAAALFAAIDVGRLDRYHWYRRFSPAWFARTLGLTNGLRLQRVLHRLRGGLRTAG